MDDANTMSRKVIESLIAPQFTSSRYPGVSSTPWGAMDIILPVSLWSDPAGELAQLI